MSKCMLLVLAISLFLIPSFAQDFSDPIRILNKKDSFAPLPSGNYIVKCLTAGSANTPPTCSANRVRLKRGQYAYISLEPSSRGSGIRLYCNGTEPTSCTLGIYRGD